MPVHQLLVQRRMRPEISDLIRSTIYNQLVDGDEVKSYPSLAGEQTLYLECINANLNCCHIWLRGQVKFWSGILTKKFL